MFLRLSLYDENGMETMEYLEYNHADFMQAVPNGVLRGSGEKETGIVMRSIPGFNGYLITAKGDVYLGDGPLDEYPAWIKPIDQTHRPYKYNLMANDGTYHVLNETGLLRLTFPEGEQ